MNRRLFLASLLSAFVADPERLFWVPGAKLISIPAQPLVELYPILDALNETTLRYITPRVYDEIFNSSPMFVRLKIAHSIGA